MEGDHRPGASPALVKFDGDVVYGTFATIEMELGGTARGTNTTRSTLLGSSASVARSMSRSLAEPTSLAFIGIGMLTLVARRRKSFVKPMGSNVAH